MDNLQRLLEQYPNEMKWLMEYRGDFPFYLSLLEQAKEKGYLSEKQISAIQKAVNRETPKVEKQKVVRNSYNIGEQISITSGIARGIMEKNPGLKVCFRNLEIVHIERETTKAILVDVEFLSRIVTSCHICGQPLDTEVSKACGIGPTCAKKIGFNRPKATDAAEILKAVESFASQVGVIRGVWLPKSFITRIVDEDLAVKIAFAEQERKQEEMAFMSDPDLFGAANE